MAQKKTPGVYVEEKSLLPPSVTEVATAIPAFVGYTNITKDSEDQDITNKPVRITSMAEFNAIFGSRAAETFIVKAPTDGNYSVLRKIEQIDATDDSTANATDVDPQDGARLKPQYLLAFAVEHYFANGGGACYIISTGATTATPSKDDFIEALAVIKKVDEVTLIHFVDAHGIESNGKTDLVAYYDLQSQAISQCSMLKDRFTLIDVVEQADGALASEKISKDVEAMRNSVIGDLKYAGSYYPNVLSTYARHYELDTVTVYVENPEKQGIYEAIELYKLGGLDANGDANPSEPKTNTDIFNKVLQVLGKNYVILPPCAGIAGIMAKVDASRGVWKAPANVAMTSVQMPMKNIKNSDQESLNVDTNGGKSVNAIRYFTGKGNLVWGARTLAGNDNEWRYVSVRRFFNMVEESIQKSTQFAVFEPNTPFTWLKIRTMIESYLEGLWRQGALFGESASQAFFVNVGLGQTMTEDDINNGYLKIEVGLAAVRPAEFIILTFSHKSIEG